MPKPDKTLGQQDRVLVIDDEKQRSLDLGQMKLIPPSVGIFDEPTRCYQINQEWAKIVMGLVGWLAEVAVWQDAQDEGYFAIEEILRFKQGVPCMPQFILRQNPSNSCLLEQSIDGGTTWTTAFDYNLCSPTVTNEANYMTITNNSIETLNEWVTNYTTINEFAPVAIYDATEDDDYRDQAVCYALGVIFDIFAELHVQNLRDGGGLKTLFQIVAGALVAIGILGSGGLAAIVIGAVIAALAEVGFAFQADVNTEQLDAIRDDLICCGYQSLKGSTPTFTAFQNAFSSCSTGDYGYDYAATELDRACQSEDVYIAFLKAVEDGYGLAKYDSLPECPCAEEPGEWEYTWDFTSVSGAEDGWERVTWGDGWFSGQGWRSQRNGTRELNYLYLYLAEDIQISYIEFEFDNPGGDLVFNLGASTGYLVAGQSLDSVNTESYRESAEGFAVDTSYVMLDVPEAVTVDTIWTTNNPYLDDDWYIVRCTLRGTGTNPFV